MYVFINLIIFKTITNFNKITYTIDYTMFCPISMDTSYKKYIYINYNLNSFKKWYNNNYKNISEHFLIT